MSQSIQAIVFEKPGQIKVSQFKLGECRDTDIVVRSLYTMVSPGTELRVLAGHYGADKQFPLVPGYSVVGEVISVGGKVKEFHVGDLISGRNPNPIPGINSYWGAQASHHVYPTSGTEKPVLLPAGSNPLDYVIAEVSSISLRGAVAARPKPGETAVVIGQGPIGAFAGAWLHAYGARVIVTDIEQSRLDRALKWGAAGAVKGNKLANPPKVEWNAAWSGPGVVDEDTEIRLQTYLNGGADIVVESSGTAGGALLAYRLLRKKPQGHGEPIEFYGANWPRLVMQANYLDHISINPFSFVPGEGVTILAPKDRGVEDRQLAVENIRRGKIRTADFIDRVVSYKEAPEAYITLRDDKNRNFSLVFDWSSAS